ncbi:MAG: hypothetical protein QS98_C0011G0082 [archaeon GW2011_AR3]|nr:MAG: hypothetical protein QS98_C0011G0082 [archaeon GW2011_AR3]MBS3109653.1 DUF4013 domain-containing protein [Candidatus Woesearchaeota archaeon]
MVDFAKAIKKPFTNWKAFIIGVLLSLIPIVKWFTKGYILESSGVGKVKASAKLQEWENWGEMFVKGLASTVITVIYMLPALIIAMIGSATFLVSLFRTYVGTIVPIDMVKEFAAGGGDAAALEAILRQNWYQAVPAVMAFAPILLLAFLFALLAWYMLPMAVLNYVATNKFGSAFQFRKVLGMAFSGDYFLTWIIVLICSAIIAALLNLVLFIGLAVMFFVVGVFSYSLYGDVYRKLA